VIASRASWRPGARARRRYVYISVTGPRLRPASARTDSSSVSLSRDRTSEAGITTGPQCCTPVAFPGPATTDLAVEPLHLPGL
jgi:hypothetical protein